MSGLGHMSTFLHFRHFLLVCAALGSSLPVSAAAPDERDRQVLETLMLHLLADSKFDMTRVTPKGGTIVLHSLTPERSGFLSYKGLKFASSIVTANLSKVWKRRPFGSFEGTYPKARGWLEAYLPGYSTDGTQAVVRAGVGPWVHGAMLTAVLAKRGDKWTVIWYHVAFFV